MPLESTRRAPLVDQVIAQLRAQIASGEWPIGERIPAEPELVTRLGVGRNTVREAVRALAHAGLLEARQGAGTYVRATSEFAGAVQRRLAEARLREIVEVRRALETESARLAALRRTASDLACLDEVFAGRERAWASGDAEAFVEADARLHQAVVAAAHNEVLAELYRDFGEALRASVRENVGPDLTPDRYVDHAPLVAAIRAADPHAAASAAAGYLDETLAERSGTADG